MASTNIRVESGVQLLARLLKRTNNIEHFYNPLFRDGPKSGEIIEMCSEISLTPLLTDVICEALTPSDLGGPQLSTILICTDGNMDYKILVSCLRKKLLLKMHSEENIDKLVQDMLSNFVILKIYDATQFYTTIHNIEQIIMEYPDTSFIIIHTLTAFYWSEQGFKITKMDSYIKNLLQLVYKNIKDYKITLLYTRPEYFTSRKDVIQNLESLHEYPALDKIDYRIRLHKVNASNECNSYQVNIKTNDYLFTNYFNIKDNYLYWIYE